jgi:hypothetical protein
MADLTEVQSSQAVKIAGANPATGAEDNFMEVDTSGRIATKISDAAGNAINLGQTTKSGSLPVTIASDQDSIPVSSAQALASGTISGSGSISVSTSGKSVVIVKTSGTWSGTLNFQTSLDNGSTWFDGIYGTDLSTGDTASGIGTADALYKLNVSGFTNFRLSAVSAITGTASVQITATIGDGVVDGINGYVYTKSFVRGASGNNITDTAVGASQALDVNVVSSEAITGVGTQGAITIGTSAIEAKVGASALIGRKLLTVFNNSGSIIYWGRTSGITTSTGTPIYEKQLMTFEFDNTAAVYLIAGGAGNNVRITESI